MYELHIKPEAVQDLAKFDGGVAKRVAQRIFWLGANLHKIERESLKGNLSDFYKFRIGDYRVLYQVDDEKKKVVVHQIEHRREIYKKR